MLDFGRSASLLGVALALLGACEAGGGDDDTGVIVPGQDAVPALHEMQELSAPGGDETRVDKWGDCPSGYSCYFVHANGEGAMWKAPSPGWFHLGDNWRDKLSSIRNRGGGTVDLYNCVDHVCSSAYYMTSVAVGQQRNLTGSYNDNVDIIRIHE